jgi:PAS domain S-box-containing protein
VVTIYNDVTDQKNSEIALKKSEERFALAMEFANDGLFDWNLETNEIYYSPVWKRLLGYEDDELPNDFSIWETLTHPQDVERSWKMQQELINKKRDRFEIEFKMKHKDGHWVDILARANAIFDDFGKAVRIIGTHVDITQRKKTEQTLKENEEKLRNIFENSTNLFYSHTPEHILTYLSPQIKDILGYTQEEAMTKWTEFVSDNPLNEIGFKNTVKAIETGERQPVYELEMVRKDGRKIRVEVREAPLVENGNVVSIVGSLTDITARKKAEENLKNQHYYLEKSQELGQIGTWELDLINNILIWTDENCKIFGVPEGSVVDYETFINKVHPSDREYVDKKWKAAVEGKPYDIEHRLLLDSEVRWVREKAEIKRDSSGKAVSAIGFTQDITDRKKTEKSLKENEELFRTVFEQAGGYCMILEPTESGIPNIFDANKAACEVHGYSREEMIGRPVADLDDDEGKRLCAERTEYILSGKTLSIENIHVRKDGSTFPVAVYAKMVNFGNRPPLIVTTEFDITDRVKAEQDRALLEKKLQQSQKLESIGTLAGGIAHDFNNILSSVIGFTEIALDDAEKGSPIEDSLKEIYSGGKRARDLVKQILAFARQSDEVIKPIQVDALVKEALKLLRASIPTTIRIDQNIKKGLMIMGNPTQVHQIIMNICTNAAQAMEDDGGILEISIKDAVIDKKDTLENLNPGEYVVIKISDTGPGIDPEIMDKIFDPYFTTKETGKGTGMGLAIVHGITKSCNGTITADSKPGQGTVFTIYLPLIRRRRGSDFYQPEILPTGNERILLVDDEVPIVKMSSQILQKLGYDVVFRTSSKKALELFRSSSDDFDLIITDMTMPEMTGDKLAAEVMSIRRDIPVILCTGYTSKISDKTAATIGIKAFAYKPVSKADLAKTVRKVLDGSKISTINKWIV